MNSKIFGLCTRCGGRLTNGHNCQKLVTTKESSKLDNLIKRLEALGNKNFLTSIAYGPSGADRRVIYTVMVLNVSNGEAFNLPYVAHSFEHCVDIAEREIKIRWIN